MKIKYFNIKNIIVGWDSYHVDNCVRKITFLLSSASVNS
jgi:hypothetical protein